MATFRNPAEPPQPIGGDPAFLAVLEQVSRLAPLDRPALIIGERGTGKELVAERLHFLSRRWDGPFVKVNCAALSETLLETELFGHEAGAFTGARLRHRGRFERADGGTLFLDEIAAASPRVQEQVLRVIEYGEYERVGGEAVLRADVRIVAATNVDLPALAERGEFRADLLDRLAFEVVTIPPLRARPADILELANAFGLAMAKAMGLGVFAGFSKAAEAQLQAHAWPGNVRELRNVVERAVYRAAVDAPIETVSIDPFDSPWRPGRVDGAAAAPSAAPQDFAKAVAAFESELVRRALTACGGRQSDAAQALGLGYHQFRRLMRKYPG
ncbi:MAG TPA: phage shock protein operon transcriptional activator [Dongiaceae bacterium]|jgi:psp operon transcriptional activator|nr:phage shock protein operon transcriptional activator [Dongiaceae bacterium]